MDGHVIHVAVRMIHVLAATILVGGSLGIAIAGWSVPAPQRGTAFIATAARFEIAFWLAFGAIVATGVGNLGVFGLGLPGPETDWGRTFVFKMALVVVLMLLSAVRALSVIRLRDIGVTREVHVFVDLYAATSALTAVIVCAAVWLAHG
ncbi:MAG: hypothetical protein O3A10_15195 [Chloroflexi bacterium]|nr:hypothetical protein [Chloroflexota bacterium]MDA1147846.1 hypothetical protein [Chloroflexota bacterium]